MLVQSWLSGRYACVLPSWPALRWRFRLMITSVVGWDQLAQRAPAHQTHNWWAGAASGPLVPPYDLGKRHRRFCMQLFDSDFLGKLEYLSLISRRIFRGTLLAQRRTMQRGSGIEFADHREYAAGDDFRYLDWN